MREPAPNWGVQLLGRLRTPAILFGQDLTWRALRKVGTHAHESFFQIDYFYAGHGTVLLKRERYDVRGGDLFISNPRDRHGFEAAGRDPLQGITFKFRLGGRRKFRFPNFVCNLRSLTGAQQRELESCLRRACAEANSDQPGHEQIASGLLAVFFVLLVRYLKAHDTAADARAEDASIRGVLDYIREHCDAPLTLGDLGRIAGLHPRYLCQKFSREQGRSPMQALTQARMERARQLLTGTKMSVAEVGVQSGYRDVYHFSKRFKAVVGLSPLRFRAKVMREM